MLKILVADDHPVFCRGLKQIVAETLDMVVADQVSSGHEALNRARTGSYDLVLLDISMPDGSGMDVLGQLRAEQPDLPVLVLSMHPEEQYAVRALKAGASGYLMKQSTPEELVTAIRKIAAGGRYVSDSLAERLAAIVQGIEGQAPHERLSDREYQVMCMIASGKTVTKIASELSLSVKTVSTYRSRILEKMDMDGIAELIRYATRNSLVD